MTDTSGDGKVVVAWLHGHDVNAAFSTSLVDLLVYDMASNRRIVNGGGRIARHASVNISGPRNAVALEFLENHSAEWLWMVDSDMTFKPDTVERLVQAADPDTAPIVGALCFAATEGNIWPTIFHLAGDAEHPALVRQTNFPLGELVECDATGAASLLVHRDVFGKMRDKFGGPYPWFQETLLGGVGLGEDLTFCLRAGLCDVPVHVHTGVEMGHVKPTLLTLERYQAQLRRMDEVKAAAEAQQRESADA